MSKVDLEQHRWHPGIARIDVRRPRSEFLVDWAACLLAATEMLPETAHAPKPEILARMAALPSGTKLADVVMFLHSLDLMIVIGKPDGAGGRP